MNEQVHSRSIEEGNQSPIRRKCIEEARRDRACELSKVATSSRVGTEQKKEIESKMVMSGAK